MTGALATPDGRWRVEVVRRDGHQAYRVWHAGVELSDLAETYDPGPRPDRPHTGRDRQVS